MQDDRSVFKILFATKIITKLDVAHHNYLQPLLAFMPKAS
jgi:hypothetical protein